MLQRRDGHDARRRTDLEDAVHRLVLVLVLGLGLGLGLGRLLALRRPRPLRAEQALRQPPEPRPPRILLALALIFGHDVLERRDVELGTPVAHEALPGLLRGALEVREHVAVLGALLRGQRQARGHERERRRHRRAWVHAVQQVVDHCVLFADLLPQDHAHAGWTPVRKYGEMH